MSTFNESNTIQDTLAETAGCNGWIVCDKGMFDLIEGDSMGLPLGTRLLKKARSERSRRIRLSVHRTRTAAYWCRSKPPQRPRPLLERRQTACHQTESVVANFIVFELRIDPNHPI